MTKKNWYLFLAITSTLTAVGFMLVVLFLTMALGAKWYEPNLAIALTETALSVGVVILGLVGWVTLIKIKRGI